MIWETPLRTGNLRDPNGPQVTFAFESFVDELAAAAKADPVQFRLDMLTDAKEDDVFRKARSLAGGACGCEDFWMGNAPVTEITRGRDTGQSAHGARHRVHLPQQHHCRRHRGSRSESRDRHVWAKRLVCAHDCGLVINPEGLSHTVECGMLHGLSRALWEEVTFDTENVTSTNWGFISQPAAFGHARSLSRSCWSTAIPLQPPDLAPYGAGECSHKPVIAAVANAIYDATGGADTPSAIPQRTGVGGTHGGEHLNEDTRRALCARGYHEALNSQPYRGDSCKGLFASVAPSQHCCSQSSRQDSHSTPVAQTDAATSAALDAALAGPHRSDRNKARDRYRHPKETLTFFGLRRGMTVVEIWPGGGWYTEVLAPVLKGKGTLYEAQYGATSTFDYQRQEITALQDKAKKNPEVFGEVKFTALWAPTSSPSRPPARPTWW